ncbi:MAG TPA: GIY-YIG nuclease family protein [Bacteroidales bacterium]|nr:GIY-YIG nuclease family protein [Bacteroidales bacterium]HZK23558.1 GIY-YIG nuclease family protein [Atopostipes sp.]
MGKTFYILQSEKNGRFYVGSSDNLNRRILEHNSGQTKSTKTGKPWKILFSFDFDDSIAGLKAERRVKALKSRKIIEKIINGSIKITDL